MRKLLLLAGLCLLLWVQAPIVMAAPILVEDHSEALCSWYKAGVTGAPLVHVDDHDDFFSALVSIDSSPEEIRSYLDSGSCAERQSRASHQIQSDALYGIADFIYPAWKLGILSEVWWVIPSKKRLDIGWLKNFQSRKSGLYPPPFLEGLHMVDGHVVGELAGLPVHMVSLDQLPAFDKPVLLDVDVDYFLGLYTDPLDKLMLTLVGDFLRRLASKELATSMVTISVSSNGGYTPTRFRYLGNWMQEALQDLPGLLRKGPPKLWQLQGGVEYADYLLDRAQAGKLNQEMKRLAPASALPFYNEAWMAAEQGDLEACLKAQDKAVRLDPRYILGFQELAGKVLAKGMTAAAERLLQRGLELDPLRASFYLELASLQMETQRHDAALQTFSTAIERLPKVPVLYAGKAFALQSMGSKAAAKQAYNQFRILAQPGRNTDAVSAVWQDMRKGTRPARMPAAGASPMTPN